MRGFQNVSNGQHCEVWIADAIGKVFSKAPPKDKRRIQKTLAHLAENGRLDFNKKQFRHEGKFSVGITGIPPIAVYAAKAYQLRVYGCYLKPDNRNMLFLCLDAKIKKNDTVTQDFLKSVAKKMGKYYET